MMIENYIGHLLIANPSNPNGDSLEKTVMMIVTHTESVAVALQINTPHTDLTLSRVSEHIGIDHEGDKPVFYGGNIHHNKIHIIHSLDWEGMTTVKLNDEIGITNDISILMALSRNEGPEYFKACSGYRLWEKGEFDLQLDSSTPLGKTSHKWEIIPATVENTFLIDPHDHWRKAIEEAARFKIDAWI